jgi:ribosomal protein S18 acetylase RimI-like enzyme
MNVTIVAARPDSAVARELIAELEAYLVPMYPAESRHGYSVEKLLREGVAFFVLRSGDGVAGCGGVQLVESEYGEIKRMYVRPAYRGQGLGRRMLDHLAAHARAHGLDRLRLETGIHQVEAIRLYEGYGFRRIPPFAPYREDPLSRYYEKTLD